MTGGRERAEVGYSGISGWSVLPGQDVAQTNGAQYAGAERRYQNTNFCLIDEGVAGKGQLTDENRHGKKPILDRQPAPKSCMIVTSSSSTFANFNASQLPSRTLMGFPRTSPTMTPRLIPAGNPSRFSALSATPALNREYNEGRQRMKSMLQRLRRRNGILNRKQKLHHRLATSGVVY